jgi:GntP family gluconate:H+ symporter
MLIVLLIIAIFFIVISTSKLKLHPFLALIIAAIGYGLFSGIPLDSIITSVNNGFGSTVGSIGIVIVAGCIIGVFLEESGGAYIMARSVMKVAGEKRVPLVMLLLGYIISIPVFADSGFVIMNPLNKALSKKAGISLAGTAIALSLGLTITHCLVPPTPGPIAATSILGADLGLVILVGLIVSLFSLVIAYIFVSKYVSRTYIDPAPNQSDHDIEEKVKNAPSAVKSFLPIVVPLLLIVLKSVSDFPTNPFGTGNFKAVMGFIGDRLGRQGTGIGCRHNHDHCCRRFVRHGTQGLRYCRCGRRQFFRFASRYLDAFPDCRRTQNRTGLIDCGHHYCCLDYCSAHDGNGICYADGKGFSSNGSMFRRNGRLTCQ